MAHWVPASILKASDERNVPVKHGLDGAVGPTVIKGTFSRLQRLVESLGMLNLNKITTLYSPDQDRISLIAELRQGGTARIWLTQRIFNRLVPALTKIVKPRHDDPVYAEIIADVAQQQAVARQEPQAAVKVTQTEHEWLVSKIDLQIPQSGAVVIFYNAAGESAGVVMNAELLRQWLSILQRVYVTAQWHGADWPEWMAVPSATTTAPKVLH